MPAPETPEESVVGAMLVAPDMICEVRSVTSPGEFLQSIPRAVFKALCALDDAKEAVDFVTTAARLEGSEDAPEGSTWQQEVVDLADRMVSGAHAMHHAGIVHAAATKRALQREIVAAGADLADVPATPDSVQAFIAELDGRIMAHGNAGKGALEDVDSGASMAIVTDAHRRGEQMTGVSTGLADLDDLLMGMRGGEMYVIGARPSKGKTALGLQIALNVARATIATTFVSLEIGTPELSERLLCNLARIDSTAMRRRNLGELHWRDMDKAAKELAALKTLRLVSDSRTTPSQLRGLARKHLRKYGLGLLIVDYLQLMHVPGAKDRFAAVGEVSRSIKGLAKELDIPILAMAQLSRAAEDVKPTLAHLRESGDIEQDSDVVILLSAGNDGEFLNADVAKNRHGKTGDVPLAFFKPHFRVALADRSKSEELYK